MNTNNIFDLIFGGNFELATQMIETSGALDYGQLDAYVYKRIKDSEPLIEYEGVKEYRKAISKKLQTLFFDEKAIGIWKKIFGEELEIETKQSDDWSTISVVHFIDADCMYKTTGNGYMTMSFCFNKDKVAMNFIQIAEHFNFVRQDIEYKEDIQYVTLNRMENKIKIYEKFFEVGDLIKEFLMQDQHINWLYHHYRNIYKVLGEFNERYKESYARMFEMVRYEKFLEMISPENLPLVLGKPKKKWTTVKNEITAVSILSVDMEKGTAESRWHKAGKIEGGMYIIKPTQWRNNNIKRLYEKAKKFIKR